MLARARPLGAVVLAPVGRADLDELLAVNRASVDLHQPWVDAPRTRRAGVAYLDKLAGEGTVGLLARQACDGRLIGLINLNEIVRGAFLSAYLGYYANAALAGRGLMTEALRLAIDHAFGPLALHRLEANVQPANLRSLALVRRLGFREEGFSPRYLRIAGSWRDHHRFAITAEEWPSGGR